MGNCVLGFMLLVFAASVQAVERVTLRVDHIITQGWQLQGFKIGLIT